jgi:CheY-like chemotaxis protein
MPATVLVVDDQADVRSLLTIVLRADPRIGLILEAEDGLTALELVRRKRPDLVVVDVMIPRPDGLEVTRRIKQGWPSTRVVVASSLADPGVRPAAYLSGADVFLDKRDITTALLQVVQRLIPAVPDGCRPRSD